MRSYIPCTKVSLNSVAGTMRAVFTLGRFALRLVIGRAPDARDAPHREARLLAEAYRLRLAGGAEERRRFVAVAAPGALPPPPVGDRRGSAPSLPATPPVPP